MDCFSCFQIVDHYPIDETILLHISGHSLYSIKNLSKEMEGIWNNNRRGNLFTCQIRVGIFSSAIDHVLQTCLLMKLCVNGEKIHVLGSFLLNAT